MSRPVRRPIGDPTERGTRRSRTVLVLLLLASLTVITLDARGSADSPVDPMRDAAGAVFGPLESGVAAGVRPFEAIGDHFASVDELSRRNQRLVAENARLRARLNTAALDRNRVREAAALRTVSADTGLQVVPAQVVAFGPAQSFSRTVTIDAGTRDGVYADMTVVDPDGLVGRVVRSTLDSATVLLIVDHESVVGGRLGSSMELGFLRGDGDLTGSGRLTMSVVDNTVLPHVGDSVVTWGSRHGAPYVAGVPIGRVVGVHSSPRDLSGAATIAPYVDFSALDLVGVVVGSTHTGHRTTLTAPGPATAG